MVSSGLESGGRRAGAGGPSPSVSCSVTGLGLTKCRGWRPGRGRAQGQTGVPTGMLTSEWGGAPTASRHGLGPGLTFLHAPSTTSFHHLDRSHFPQTPTHITQASAETGRGPQEDRTRTWPFRSRIAPACLGARHTPKPPASRWVRLLYPSDHGRLGPTMNASDRLSGDEAAKLKDTQHTQATGAGPSSAGGGGGAVSPR